jgi:glucose-6-phosphate isomerase
MRDDEGVREDTPVRFEPGLDVTPTTEPFGFRYGPGMFGPTPVFRGLDAIRASLRDPLCGGPDPVYAIAMHVGREEHRADIEARHLLFGVVTYAAGRLGDEPVRSQGHVHKVAPHSGWRPPEIYEIWSGRAVVLMQEHAADEPGRCYAIEGGPGAVIVVPPGWAHATISADPREPLTFGAWCDREYGFEYDEVRARGGLAYYPVVGPGGALEWRANSNYRASGLTIRLPRAYEDLGLRAGVPIYLQYAADPSSVQWVADPARLRDAWRHFEP